MKNGVASSKKIPLKMAERLKICCPLGYWPIRLAAIITVHTSNWPGRQKKAKNVSASLRQGLSHLTAISAHFLSRSATYVYFLFRHYSFLRALRVEKDYNIENSRKFQLLKFNQCFQLWLFGGLVAVWDFHVAGKIFWGG